MEAQQGMVEPTPQQHAEPQRIDTHATTTTTTTTTTQPDGQAQNTVCLLLFGSYCRIPSSSPTPSLPSTQEKNDASTVVKQEKTSTQTEERLSSKKRRKRRERRHSSKRRQPKRRKRSHNQKTQTKDNQQGYPLLSCQNEQETHETAYKKEGPNWLRDERKVKRKGRGGARTTQQKQKEVCLRVSSGRWSCVVGLMIKPQDHNTRVPTVRT